MCIWLLGGGLASSLAVNTPGRLEELAHSADMYKDERKQGRTQGQYEPADCGMVGGRCWKSTLFLWQIGGHFQYRVAFPVQGRNSHRDQTSSAHFHGRIRRQNRTFQS